MTRAKRAATFGDNVDKGQNVLKPICYQLLSEMYGLYYKNALFNPYLKQSNRSQCVFEALIYWPLKIGLYIV